MTVISNIRGVIGAKKGDDRVRRLLDQLDLKYSIDSDGDFRVSFALPDDRSQTVFIRSNTSRLGNLEIREVFSVAYESQGPLPAEVANALLVVNAHAKLGAWSLLRATEERCYAAFTARIAADTDIDALMTTIRAVLETADDVEMKLNGGEDRF